MLLFRVSSSCLALIAISLSISFHSVATQQTILDIQGRGIYRQFRQIWFNFIGRSGHNRRNIEMLRKMGKLQDPVPKSTPFICDVKGPGARSPTPPTSVHELRPGDIDIIAAMGDSLTAGNGGMSTDILQVTMENKGVVFSIGGQGDWRTYLTLPNILKEFNPNLYGYSLGDALPFQHATKLNVAELAAISSDMPFQARVLVQRLSADRRVNMTHHWKLLTIMFGDNDFCAHMCYESDPRNILKIHEKSMLKVLRTLRDNIPRLMVNVVPPPNIRIITEMTGTPLNCVTGLQSECPCFYGSRARRNINEYSRIIEEFQQLDAEIINREEFHNKSDFTVNYQTFTRKILFPKTSNGISDFTYQAADCFHLSQKGYARGKYIGNVIVFQIFILEQICLLWPVALKIYLVNPASKKYMCDLYINALHVSPIHTFVIYYVFIQTVYDDVPLYHLYTPLRLITDKDYKIITHKDNVIVM